MTSSKEVGKNYRVRWGEASRKRKKGEDDETRIEQSRRTREDKISRKGKEGVRRSRVKVLAGGVRGQ